MTRSNEVKADDAYIHFEATYRFSQSRVLLTDYKTVSEETVQDAY